MTRVPVPEVEPFPPPFRAMLAQILRGSRRIAGARREVQRSRRQALVQSGTFVGHRPYVRGDELRRIDWHAFARTGHLFAKVLAEDERRASTLLIDASASMLAGAVPRRILALRLAAILGGLALVHLDGIFVQAERSAQFAGRAAVAALLEHLAALPCGGPDRVDSVAALLRQRAPGKVHWISDFADPARTERMLLQLRRRGYQVTGWLPVLSLDTEVPALGWTTIVDPETGEQLALRVDRDLAAAMAHELQVLARQQERVFARAGAPLQRLVVDSEDFDAAHWLEAGWSFRR